MHIHTNEIYINIIYALINFLLRFTLHAHVHTHILGRNWKNPTSLEKSTLKKKNYAEEIRVSVH